MKKVLVQTFVCITFITGSLTLSNASTAKVESEEGFFASEEADTSVQDVVDWIVKSQNNRGKPFMVVDKKKAKLFVFDMDGRILAATPVLLGLTRGDVTTPGIGKMKPSEIPRKDRTTAAGKFLLQKGMDLEGGKVLWLDYESGLAIHSIPEKNKSTRLKQLKSKNPNEHRATLGCVNVTKEFYLTILSPLFDHTNGYAYILPETMPVERFFGIGG